MRIEKYSCPVDCGKRTETCHQTCTRHKLFREVARRLREARAEDMKRNDYQTMASKQRSRQAEQRRKK